MQRSAWFKVVVSMFILAVVQSVLATGGFNARLQGQSRGSSTWINGNLQNWRDLDEIPCRVYLMGGPANNKVIKVEFDHMQGRNPGIQDLYGFAPSANVQITSAPVLSAPANSPRWTYTFTVKLLDRNAGAVNFYARLADGAHLNGGSSVGMRGSPSLGNLQIHKPGPRPAVIDLAVKKSGPSEAAPGEVITYTLLYSNKAPASAKASYVRVSDVLPPQVTVVSNTIAAGRVIGNTIVWDVGSVAVGASGTFTYSVQVNAGLAYGTVFTNSAVIACIAKSKTCKRVKSAQTQKDDDDDDDDDGDRDDDDDGGGKCVHKECKVPCPTDANPGNNHSSVTTRVVFNRAPVANADFYTGIENQPLIVPAPGVLVNDTDADGDGLSAILVSGPAHGSVMLNTNGSFTYTPNAGYHGEDSFTYKANDGMADSPAVSVRILLQPVPHNDMPVAANDEYGTPTDSILNVPAAGVLANDSDADGDPLSAILVAGPLRGTLSFNANGSFQYTPPPGFSGTDTFTYKANDGVLDSLPAIVTIAIRGSRGEPPPPPPTNAPPVVTLTSPTNGAIYIEGMNIPLIAEASDTDGTIALVDFMVGETILGADTEAPYGVMLTNVSTGEYVFHAIATDDDGATGTSAPVAVTVIEHPPFAAGPFWLNRQTGLFEQRVTITNPTPFDFAGIRLWVMDVRGGATIWNASGRTDGVPHLEIPGIPAGGSLEAVIVYYTPDIRVAPEPRFLPEVR